MKERRLRIYMSAVILYQGSDDLPVDDFGTLSSHLIDIEAAIVAVLQERTHVELSVLVKLPLTNLKHGAPFGDALPCGVQEFSVQRVQGHINTFTPSLS